MTTSSPVPSISTFTLRLADRDDEPLWPVVQVLVDGVDVLAQAAPGWHGFDPDVVLGPDDPWLPTSPPRRVAVYRCSCGYAPCGAITAVVTENDGLVTWSDVRRGTCDDHDLLAVELAGRDLPGGLDARPALVFDAVAYRAELERVGSRRLWDSHERLVTIALRHELETMRDELAQDGLAAWSAWPVRDPEGRVRFAVTLTRGGRRPVEHLDVDLGRTPRGDVDEAAQALVERLRRRLPAFAASRS